MLLFVYSRTDLYASVCFCCFHYVVVLNDCNIAAFLYLPFFHKKTLKNKLHSKRGTLVKLLVCHMHQTMSVFKQA